MSWNKKTYYYQNQMKVLSGSDAEPGYKESDTEAQPSDLNQRISHNGLYKFVSLIKAKFDKHDAVLKNMWTLGGKGLNKYQFEIPRWENLAEESDINKYYEKGNYWGRAKSETVPSDSTLKPNKNIKNTPVANYAGAFILKVSSVGSATAYVQQDFQDIDKPNRRYHRYGKAPYVSGDYDFENFEWGPWFMVLDTSLDPDTLLGNADELFLKRKNDWTVGSIGFGKDPSMTGRDVSKLDNVKAKIVLGEYNYGTELPDEHYAQGPFADNAIPKGQIYLQYVDYQ